MVNELMDDEAVSLGLDSMETIMQAVAIASLLKDS
jgi:hypothetical protein